MRKQGLIEPFNDPAETLEALGLIDAALLPAAYYALFVRSKNASPLAIAQEAQAGRRMARLPGLKGSPQLISRDLMPHVYALTRESREGRAAALLGGWGIDESEYRRCRQAIRDTLQDKEKTLSQLKNSLPAGMAREVVRRHGRRIEKTTNVAVVAQVMGQRWELLRGGVGRAPFEDPGRYSLFERRFGPMRLDGPRADAVAALARVYVERYGPVAPGDFAWWTGLPKGEAAAAFGRLNDPVSVEIEGTGGRFYVYRGELPDSGPGPAFPVKMLSNDDPYAKAYADRARFVPEPCEGRVITKFGESAPVVLVDGTVHGFWGIRDRTCNIEMAAGPENVEKEIGAAAASAGRFFTGGAIDVTFSPYRPKA